MKSIEQEWKDFSAMVFQGVNPSPVQVEEMKRAFFAGAWAVLCALESEEIAYERSLLAAEMAEECRQFKQDVLAGKA